MELHARPARRAVGNHVVVAVEPHHDVGGVRRIVAPGRAEGRELPGDRIGARAARKRSEAAESKTPETALDVDLRLAPEEAAPLKHRPVVARKAVFKHEAHG